MLSIEEVGQRIRGFGLVPAVEVADVDQAERLYAAMTEAGLPIIEITLRTPGAATALESLIRKYPDAVLGAGTVLDVEGARRMVDIGSSFIVSPGMDEEMVEFCLERQVLIIPGVCTPTEVQSAMRAGARLLKFYPAEISGGLAFLKALAGPFRGVDFVPTGGIGPSNLAEYLRLPNVAACGGSWMTTPKLLSEGRFAEINDLVREALVIVQGVRSGR